MSLSGASSDSGSDEPQGKKSLEERLNDRLDASSGRESGVGSTGRGFGRILVAVYAILAIAATARGAWQLIDHGHEAPLAYSLSLLAGIIYIVATVALAMGSGVWRRVAWGAVVFEAVGVLAVGISTLVSSDAFPDKTVWSNFGQGYGYIPLVLPFVGIFWLWKTSAGRQSVGTDEA
jgi:hypothetical protein